MFTQLKEKILLKKGTVTYQGNYHTWEEANMYCEGYDSQVIFDKVKEAALMVKQGKACYERDSQLFYKKEYNYPLLFHLGIAAKENENILKVIDWGGSLGSTYFQNQEMLQNNFKNFTWTIIEQEHFVKFGRELLRDDYLDFANNFSEVKNLKEYNVILLSSVLQYLSFHLDLINDILKICPDYIIIERTPVGNRKRIWIERVREPIYNASYACCVFKEEDLISLFCDNGYTMVDNWDSLVDGEIHEKDEIVRLRSFVFKRKHRRYVV